MTTVKVSKLEWITWALVCCLAIGVKAAAQQTTRPERTEVGGRESEYIAVLFAGLRAEAVEIKKPIILIARLGDGEYKRDLNYVRLDRAFWGLTFGAEVPTVIKAEGERVKGAGRVEVYVDGILRLVILTERNKYICVSCCDGCLYTPRWYTVKKTNKQVAQQQRQ